MNQKNEQTPPANNMEQLQQQASSCGAECNCHAAGNSGRGRWLVGGIVLLAAGALVVRAVMTDGPKPTPTKETAKTFVAPAVVTVPADAAAVAAPKAATATVSMMHVRARARTSSGISRRVSPAQNSASVLAA